VRATGANDTDLYQLVSNSYIEFLDVEKENVPVNLVQPVHVLFLLLIRFLLNLDLLKCQQAEVGKKHKVFGMKSNGLWQYQFNDTVDVAEFTPAKWILLILYIEHKGSAEHIFT